MRALPQLFEQSRLRHLRLRLLFLLVLLLGGLGTLRAEGSAPDSLSAERVERIGAFDREKLERSFGLVRFRSSAQARYALDLGDESWYLGSVKMDAYYKEFARGYIAPWKLIPTGERDVVEAYYEGSKDIDLSRVRFASTPDSPALPADYDGARRAWTLTLPATESNSTYEVFALYGGKVIGKLRVVSYPKQSYKLRLVPVNGQSLGDVSRLSQQLNSIYNKYGVSFTLSEGEGVSTELKAKSLSQDLRTLRDDYEAQHSLSGDEVCLFILSAELSKGSKYEELEGLMPLTPIVIVPSGEQLPLVETALGGNVLSNQMYVVPAIFLKYRGDKIRNDYIEKGVITTLDVATIALSGGTALATKVHWVRRAWALAEVAGAVGNIAVNTQAVSNPEFRKLVDNYNLAMGLIGIKQIGQAGYKFVKNLPEETKILLQRNGELHQMLLKRYQAWEAQRVRLRNNISLEEKQLIQQQERGWSIVGVEGPKIGSVMPGQARKIAIERFGQEAEEFITVKFKENGGAVAEIIANFGEEGMRVLKEVERFEDVAPKLVEGKVGYRYIGSQAGYIEELKQTGIIPARVGNGEHYFTISKFDNPTEAISKLQLNGEMTDAAWRAEFKIDQIKSSISFPYAKWGEARNVEVITRSYPQFGERGTIQFITEGQIRLLRLVNIKTGEIVTF